MSATSRDALVASVGQLAGASVCDLLTIGRVTGAAHAVELWFGTDGERVSFLAGGRNTADWVRNMRVSPDVRVTIAGRTFEGRAAFVEGTEREPVVRRLLAAKYQGWSEGRPMSRWARTALPVEVTLARETASMRG